MEANAHVYVGTSNIRRGGSGASAAADVSSGGNTLYSMPSALARTFAIVVREVMNITAQAVLVTFMNVNVAYC